MPKVFSLSFTLPFIPNSLNNFQIVLGSDFPSSIFDLYVFLLAISISFVTLLRSSLYAEVFQFNLYLFRSFVQSSISGVNHSG